MDVIRRFRRIEGSTAIRRKVGAALVGGLVLAAVAGSSAATARAGSGQADLAKVRAATAEFHRVEVAEAAGHQLGWKDPDFPITGCISHPTDGAMGYHWFDHDAIEDIALDPLQPEAFVYEPLPNGKLHLVASSGSSLPKRGTPPATRVRPPSWVRSWASSTRRWAGTSCTPGCGSRTRRGCSTTGIPT